MNKKHFLAIIPKTVLLAYASVYIASLIVYPLSDLYIQAHTSYSYWIISGVLAITYILITASNWKVMTLNFKKLMSENIDDLIIMRLLRAERENDIFKKILGFRDTFLPKVLLFLMVSITMCVLYATILIRTEYDKLNYHQIKFLIYTMGLLGMISTIAYAHMIFGRRSTEICMNCNRINAGTREKPVWKNLTSFGSFSHGICDKCAEAMMNEKLIGPKLLGNILIEKFNIPKSEIERALEEQEAIRRTTLGELLITKGILDKDILQKALEYQNKIQKEH